MTAMRRSGTLCRHLARLAIITTTWTIRLQPISRSVKIQCVGRRDSHGKVRGVVSEERLMKVKKRRMWEMKPMAPKGIV